MKETIVTNVEWIKNEIKETSVSLFVPYFCCSYHTYIQTETNTNTFTRDIISIRENSMHAPEI